MQSQPNYFLLAVSNMLDMAWLNGHWTANVICHRLANTRFLDLFHWNPVWKVIHTNCQFGCCKSTVLIIFECDMFTNLGRTQSWRTSMIPYKHSDFDPPCFLFIFPDDQRLDKTMNLLTHVEREVVHLWLPPSQALAFFSLLFLRRSGGGGSSNSSRHRRRRWGGDGGKV